MTLSAVNHKGIGDVQPAAKSKQALCGRILTIEEIALPVDLAGRTDVARQVSPSVFEQRAERLGFRSLARRWREFWHAWSFFREAEVYPAIVTLGDLTGLMVAFLNRIFRRQAIHVMYDCLWYGGSAIKRAWMRYCILGVDICVVWASVECERYAKAYGVPQSRFRFVPHHHTTKRYQFEVEDGGYLFTGGNWSRDYELFLHAVRDLEFPCILATNRPELLQDLEIPKNVRVINATPEEFRQLIARSRFVVLPMRADLLHSGGQQTFLNAMMMGKPVVLTDPEGGRDYIVDRETGVLVPYGDVEALREAIVCLAKDPEMVRAMGERARQSAMPLDTVICNIRIWEHIAELMKA